MLTILPNDPMLVLVAGLPFSAADSRQRVARLTTPMYLHLSPRSPSPTPQKHTSSPYPTSITPSPTTMALTSLLGLYNSATCSRLPRLVSFTVPSTPPLMMVCSESRMQAVIQCSGSPVWMLSTLMVEQSVRSTSHSVPDLVISSIEGQSWPVSRMGEARVTGVSVVMERGRWVLRASTRAGRLASKLYSYSMLVWVSSTSLQPAPSSCPHLIPSTPSLTTPLHTIITPPLLPSTNTTPLSIAMITSSSCPSLTCSIACRSPTSLQMPPISSSSCTCNVSILLSLYIHTCVGVYRMNQMPMWWGLGASRGEGRGAGVYVEHRMLLVTMSISWMYVLRVLVETTIRYPSQLVIAHASTVVPWAVNVRIRASSGEYRRNWLPMPTAMYLSPSWTSSWGVTGRCRHFWWMGLWKWCRIRHRCSRNTVDCSWGNQSRGLSPAGYWTCHPKISWRGLQAVRGVLCGCSY